MRLLCHFIFAIALSIAALFYGGVAANCTELLINGSFENPVAPNNGNNFYTSLPNWAVVPGSPSTQPINIVVPFSGYGNNPQATPVGGARQYLDLNGIGGVISQSVNLTCDGLISMGVWFSVREGSRNLSGAIIRLRNASNVIAASASVVFTTADPISTWKRASVTNFPLPRGSYTMEIVIDNFHNIDFASFDFVPTGVSLEIDKSADKTGPLVAGDAVTYTYLVKNNGTCGLTNVYVEDSHNGANPLPAAGSEVLVTDAAPTGDTTDPTGANGNWDTLGPGDTVRFTATYPITQADVDLLQ